MLFPPAKSVPCLRPWLYTVFHTSENALAHTILSNPEQSCERGKSGAYIPILWMRKQWLRGVVRLAPPAIYWPPPPGGAEFECSLLTPKASAFSISFHKNGAQQSYSLKAIMLVSLQIPCSQDSLQKVCLFKNNSTMLQSCRSDTEQ